MPHYTELVMEEYVVWLHDNTVKPPVPSSIDVSCVSGVRTHLPPAAGGGAGGGDGGAAAVAPPPPQNTERRELTISCSQHGGFDLSLLPNGTVVGFGVSCACELPACRYSKAERAGVRLGWRCAEIDGGGYSHKRRHHGLGEARDAGGRRAARLPRPVRGQAGGRPRDPQDGPKRRNNNLDTGGLKQALLARLYTAIAAEGTHNRSPPAEPQCGASAGCASSVTTADDGGATPPPNPSPLPRPAPSFLLQSRRPKASSCQWPTTRISIWTRSASAVWRPKLVEAPLLT
jgi:hypothetical protein